MGMETWVLLRGLARESGHWGSFTREIQLARPGCRVLCLDLPGNGALYRQRSPASVAAMVAHCQGALAERGIDGPVHLLALSLGAMVATAWSHARPDQIAAQVLINTSLRPFSPLHWRLRPANYPTLLRLALPGVPALVRERLILQMTSRRGDASVLPLWLALRRQHPVAVGNALRQLLAAVRYRAPAEVRVPTLLLASREDGLVDSRCSMALAQRWHCELRMHPDAGHDLPLDDGRWLAGCINQWLTAMEPSRA